jgi:hypothetical protein
MKHIIENIFDGITSTRNPLMGDSILRDKTMLSNPALSQILPENNT